jgi:hypothetical protein
MVHWHEPGNLAGVVVKVYLNDDANIPDSVKVNAGLPRKVGLGQCHVLF